MCTIANAIANHYYPPSPQCHQVSMFTCVRVVVFSALSMHHTQCKRRAIGMRNCRAPERRVRDVSSKGVGLAAGSDVTVNKPNLELPFSWTGSDVTRKQT